MDDILLCKYFNNQASAEEVEEIERWLKSDPSHREEFDAAHMMFNAMIMREISRTVGSADLRSAAPAAPAEQMPRPRRWRRYANVALRVCAVLVLMAGVGAAGLHFGRRKAMTEVGRMVQSIEVPAGERVSVTLPDGTNVFLNGGSRIEYPPVFAERERRVKMSGEALFTVTHDASHPFIVETFASEIEVLGTTFNVFTDEIHSRFSTTLAEGKVRVSLLDGSEQLTLRPDEMALFDNGRLIRRSVDADDALCWTNGYISIGGVSFEELMSRFERAFDVNIVISRPTMPSIGYVSGKIRIAEGVEFAMEILRRASDFEFEFDRSAKRVIIK